MQKPAYCTIKENSMFLISLFSRWVGKLENVTYGMRALPNEVQMRWPVVSTILSRINSQKAYQTINLYSDNCGGQNRNRIVFMMYSIAAKKFNVNISHKFLEKGHTQNENDSIHALIERSSKNKEIYTPDQWFALVRWAKDTGNPYIVKEVSIEDILDFKKLLAELRQRYLQFSVYDFDRFSRHDLIGHVVLKGLLESADLHQEIEYTMNILAPPQEKKDLGELMLSLCYLPTAGRLTVTVIKGRNLKAMDINGSSDPYVKICLICQGKRIKKKKTTVKKNTLSPVYNEALVFDLPAENVYDVTLLVKVIDYDLIGPNELIGCTAIGSSLIGIGRDHWLEMLDNARKPVAQWYPLNKSPPANINLPTNSQQNSTMNCFNMR
ncbi:unnamed protein product [Euphydryas editha]|uniref:C2 domain-containing protein n=1 Tax=Euphydryas editha TaxID=104508 RepID=A0AAU9TMY2_EUPED|nr:unnamed protein product [Euphydryas editha]